ncbi:ATP-binding protein [Achromobacter seleniivolatilans]|uniref:ATP-binding protein n=1 Tax=Achromobacter seleniivolatilans TaxID=3047478 RepID=A0ABY9M6W2_9BURK|nr:ATP-binding protein [Achromobacter sp. R39]WMD22724.1 ATP-binding protein [Achromobacter sp. R39]
MTTLETYLTEEYPVDSRDLADIETMLVSVAKIYKVTFSDDHAWPYQLSDGEGSAPKSLSQSTTAMIINALLRFGGFFSDSGDKNLAISSKANIFKIDSSSDILLAKKKGETDNSLMDRIFKACGALLHNIEKKNHKGVTHSATYGNDDVFTLAWLAEISQANWTEFGACRGGGATSSNDFSNRWADIAVKVKECALNKAKAWVKARTPKVLFKPAGGISVNHAFPVLRLVQIIRRLSGPIGSTQNSEELVAFFEESHKFFETTLHEQLSFSSIPDSRFDPAELMFCLEGMLISRRSSVDRTVFDRVLSVLKDTQHESAYWRPVKPFMSTMQGLVLFPVSVEIANSLMRACEIFDAEEIYDTYGSKCMGLLRRYWQWLRARAVRVAAPDGGDGEMVGWHSEHVNTPNVVHLWETSQVMDFMLAFRNSLHRHVARKTLVLSRFTHEVLKTANWSEIKNNEPVSGLGEPLKIYERIGESFVESQSSRNSINKFSMLLYGPPGTGKTTVAESVAKALGRRLITITVSDFLASGGIQVEARAKHIFTALMAQPECVILFDEIDHFLLDRDSNIYATQDTVFQFMTPGMLTKLNDLRRKERAFFIVATNYEDRIDSAIKRTGRIDEKYLVLPPDGEKRIALIHSFLSKVDNFSTNLEKIKSDIEARRSDLIRASLFLGYTDLKATIAGIRVEQVEQLVDMLDKTLRERARTTSIEAYSSRFVGKTDPRKTPMQEFFCLLALHCEAYAGGGQLCAPEDSTAHGRDTTTGLTSTEMRAVKSAIATLGADEVTEVIAEGWVRTYASELDDGYRKKVAVLLRKVAEVR